MLSSLLCQSLRGRGYSALAAGSSRAFPPRCWSTARSPLPTLGSPRWYRVNVRKVGSVPSKCEEHAAVLFKDNLLVFGAGGTWSSVSLDTFAWTKHKDSLEPTKYASLPSSTVQAESFHDDYIIVTGKAGTTRASAQTRFHPDQLRAVDIIPACPFTNFASSKVLNPDRFFVFGEDKHALSSDLPCQVAYWECDTENWVHPTCTGSPPDQRTNVVVANVGRSFYTFTTNHTTGLMDTHRLDSDTLDWSLIETDEAMTPPAARHMSATVVAGKIVLIGGTVNSITSLLSGECIWVFDPSSGQWETADQAGDKMKLPSKHTATSLSDGRMVVLGGVKGFLETASKDIFLLEVEE